jgi:hypothetical protein
MPKPPWRFEVGDIAYVRPALPQYRVKLIEPIRLATDAGIVPCWLVVDDAGKSHQVLQIELSGRPVSIEKGRVTLLRGTK